MNSVSNANNIPLQQPSVKPEAAVVNVETKESSSALQKIADYFEPRPETTGDMPYSSPKSAATGGALKGFFSLGIPGAVAGAGAGFAGVSVGEETGSMTKALLAGSTVGAGALLTSTAITSSLAGGAAGLASIGIMAAAGAVAGATGTLIEKLQNSKIQKTDESGKPVELSKTKSIIKKMAPIAAGAATGAAMGAIGGPVTAIAGAVVGAIGGMTGSSFADKLSENATTKETAKMSLLTATLAAGGGAVAGAVAAIATSANPAAAGLALGSTALMGGLTGATATISGSSRAETRDGSFGGFTAGMLTTAFTGIGGPAVNLSASIGGAVGARMESKAKKIALSAATGAALGAVSGSFAGPAGIATGAVIGAGASVAGALAGPKIQQAIRNLTADVQKFIKPLTGKVSDFVLDKLGVEKGLTTVGALTGALGAIPLAVAGGALLGPIGAAATLVVSAVAGGVKFAKIAKDITQSKNLDQKMQQLGPSTEDINNFMCANAFRQIEPQLAGMTDEQKAAFYQDLSTQSLAELNTKQKEIDALRKNISSAVYNELKKPLKDIKGKENKDKFISEQIEMAKDNLTAVMAEGVLAILQNQGAQENEAQQQQQ